MASNDPSNPATIPIVTNSTVKIRTSAAFVAPTVRKIATSRMTLPRNYGADYIAAFEKVYSTLAAKYKVTLIPFFLEGAAGKPELNLEDGIHPNVAGYRYVTANVWKYLEPMLKK